ncbi:MAG: glycosyltransferase [Candidatus Pacebacteria bacterium]|nr:glycosyltransferase [Candidatus Paceibacterota bacterium]
MDKNVKNKKPKITVLMPVYNGEKYLEESIKSILNQTFTDFEFLIINDASTDESKNIINSFNDPRIKLVENEENIGLTKSLNKGLILAQGEYVARMDDDDISLPKRFQIQVNLMNKNPKIGVVGTWAKVIGESNKKYIKTYSNFEKIKALSIFKNILIHPSVMMRKNILDKYDLKYNEELTHSQDYDLWARLMLYSPITNIKKILILYRIHKENESHLYTKIQTQNSNKTRIKQLKNLKIIPTDEEKIIHCNTYKPKQYEITEFLNKTEQWLFKLIKQNNKIKYSKEPQFSMILANRWFNICSVNSDYDFKIWKRFWESNLRKKLDYSDIENWKILTRFFFKCLLKKSR